jgi:hypothetical protein
MLPPQGDEPAVAVSQKRHHRESLELGVLCSGARFREPDHAFVRSDIAKPVVRQPSSEDVLEACASEENCAAAQHAERALETFDSPTLKIFKRRTDDDERFNLPIRFKRNIDHLILARSNVRVNYNDSFELRERGFRYRYCDSIDGTVGVKRRQGNHLFCTNDRMRREKSVSFVRDL